MGLVRMTTGLPLPADTAAALARKPEMMAYVLSPVLRIYRLQIPEQRASSPSDGAAHGGSDRGEPHGDQVFTVDGLGELPDGGHDPVAELQPHHPLRTSRPVRVGTAPQQLSGLRAV